jgi:hypothetical protein
MLAIWKTSLPLVFTGLLFAAGQGSALGQTSATVLNEAMGLIRTNLPGTSAAELDRAALDGLVGKLSPRVRWAGVSESNATTVAVSRVTLHDGEIGYVRAHQVGASFAADLRNACDRLLSTNKLQGLVLDLRYAKGQHYSAAADSANLFLGKERPLLNWGQGLRNSTFKTNHYSFPVALLVNGETAGAAEALAAVFRSTGVGLIVGTPTLGQAAIYQEFKLSNGQSLLIARAPIKLGDGEELPSAGLKPDIQVSVNPETERLFYADAFSSAPIVDLGGTNSLSSTNRSRRFRISEADLVRERREGFDPDTLGSNEPEKPVVRDPALARALDVLKGLAVVRHARPDFHN